MRNDKYIKIKKVTFTAKKVNVSKWSLTSIDRQPI